MSKHQLEETINSVNANTGADFHFMNVNLKIVCEHWKTCDKILIILPDEVELDSAEAGLKQFTDEMRALFTGLNLNCFEEVHNHLNEMLVETGLTAQNANEADDTFINSIKVELKQFFIYISKPVDGEVTVEYAFGLNLYFRDENERRGLFKIFSLDSVCLNVWNVSPDSKIYKKMGIQTIEDLLR